MIVAGSRYEITRSFSLKVGDATCLCANGDAPEGKKKAGDAEQGLGRQGNGPSHKGGCFRGSVSTGGGVGAEPVQGLCGWTTRKLASDCTSVLGM